MARIRWRRAVVRAAAAAALGGTALAACSTGLGGAGAAAVPMVAAAVSAPHVPAGASASGALSGATTMHVSVALEPSDPGGLERLAAEVSTPASPEYHRFLAPAEVERQFGPSAASVAAVRGWLASQGLAVGATSGDGLDVPATGPASTVEAAFRTPIDRYTLAGGRRVFVNAAVPEVPADLRGPVAAVLGLDDLQQPHDDLAPRVLGPSDPGALQPPAPAVGGAPSACPEAASVHGNTASDMAALFDLDPLYQEGRLGQGTTVGLFEDGKYPAATLATYEACYGIGTKVTKVLVDGGTPSSASGTPTWTTGSGEVLLDIETVAALAPDATIVDYEGNGTTSTFAGFYDVYSAMVQQNRAQVISTSWGFSNCELAMIDGGVNLSLVEAPLFQEMAVQGQSMMTASGDQGSEGCATTVGTTGTNQSASPTAYALTVEDPANQPFITAIGGTMVHDRETSPAAQAVWNQTGPDGTGSGFTAPFDGTGQRPQGYPGNLAGSGGISAFFQQPPWQVGIDGVGGTENGSGVPCGSPVTVTTTTVDCRELPDASGLAWSTVGYAKGHWGRTGGTSAASPQWAAFLALVDQGLPQGRLGLVSPALYQIAQDDPAAFTDVVDGQDDYLSTTSALPAGTAGNRICSYAVTGLTTGAQPCYAAVSGYDMATGLG
ncbi:MAG TPA: S53 family peptidase, partial [Acidimicrobiales bacterium]|nr:S53 family peptidase [Acidimicrobiales bacterium]